MLCLTHPRTCTYAHAYFPYRLKPSSVECYMSIGARFGNRDDPLCNLMHETGGLHGATGM